MDQIKIYTQNSFWILITFLLSIYVSQKGHKIMPWDDPRLSLWSLHIPRQDINRYSISPSLTPDLAPAKDALMA